MSGIAVRILVQLVVAPGVTPPQAVPSTTCQPTVTPRAVRGRGEPQSGYQQARASMPLVYPHHLILADQSDGRIGKVEYYLLVYQVTPTASVTLQATAVDWNGRKRAWDLDATCAVKDWPAGLIAMMEALAALPALPGR